MHSARVILSVSSIPRMASASAPLMFIFKKSTRFTPCRCTNSSRLRPGTQIESFASMVTIRFACHPRWVSMATGLVASMIAKFVAVTLWRRFNWQKRWRQRNVMGCASMECTLPVGPTALEEMTVSSPLPAPASIIRSPGRVYTRGTNSRLHS